MTHAAQGVPEEDNKGRPSGSSIVLGPVEEIEERIPWCVDFSPLRRADTACGTDYAYAQGAGAVPAVPDWAPFTLVGEPARPAPGTLLWVPYGLQSDPQNSVMMPGHPAPGHQFVAMEVPAMGMRGPAAGGDAMALYAVPGAAASSGSSPSPRGEDGAEPDEDVRQTDVAGEQPAASASAVFMQAPPEAERSHYIIAAGPVWMGPKVYVAYCEPIASYQVSPPMWITNAPPPFEHARISAFTQQPAPEGQAGAQLSGDAGSYAEEVEVPRGPPLASGAIAARGCQASAVFLQAPPEAERTYYMPAAGSVWMGPNVYMAYGQPIASHPVSPPVFWITNGAPPFEYAGIAALPQQPAPEEQAGAQLSGDAGSYGEEVEVPRDSSLASAAIAARGCQASAVFLQAHPEAERSHYMPAAGPVWMGPNVHVAYGQPIASHQVSPPVFWITNVAPSYEHAGFAVLPQQPAPEEQAGAQLSGDAGSYGEEVEVPRDSSLASGAIAARGGLASAVFLQAPPEAERSHYMPAAGSVWIGPNVYVAYAQPIASHQVSPPVFWITNGAPPFEHAVIAALPQQPAPEEQAGAQLSGDAGTYAEEEVPRDASLASGAIAARGCLTSAVFLQEPPEAERSHYMPAAGPVWMGPNVHVAYGQPIASHQVSPPVFWITNVAPSYEHAGIAALPQQPAPEEQAGAQLSEDAGSCADEEVPRDSSPASGTIAGEKLGEHTEAVPEISTISGAPPEMTAKDGLSTVPPEAASGDLIAPPPQPAATVAVQPAKRTPEVRAVASRAEEDAVAAFVLDEWTKAKRAGKGNYYEAAKARRGRRAL